MILELAKMPCIYMDTPILKENMQLVHVVSEPGDGTRYDYLVYRDGPDRFCFMPARSTFRFPQRLDYWKDKDYDVNLLAVEHNCNPWTIIECIRIMKELHK